MTLPAVPLRRRDRTRSLAVLALGCAASVLVLYVVAEWSTVGQELDQAALEGRGLENPDVRETTDRLLLTITSSSLALLGLAVAGLALLRRRIDLALAALAAILAANLTTQVLKLALPRPNLLGPDGVAFGQSLPSGHATAAMSLAVALALVLPTRIRAVGVLPLLAWALFVGAGVLATGWHRPSDVICAYAIATGWAALAAIVVVRRRPAPAVGQNGGRAGPAWRLMLVVGIAALVVGFVGATVGALTIDLGGVEAVDVRAEFVLATAAIVGSGLLLMAALVAALRGPASTPWPHARIPDTRPPPSL